ncbi:MAG: DUF1549 and DUF1553 domain-containing protein [Verrucomicrobiales bacterium]|jgi:hypothetical protein|nr:DUF1549 and DUF1553 domain-containing protein [Verrucomicrobiales bacterium]
MWAILHVSVLLGQEVGEPASDWWSLQPVIAPAVLDADAGIDHPIDQFLHAAYRSRGLRPVGFAEKLTLLRRVYLDLIGLPPTPAEQETFLADESPEAYEKVVDRLLESEQHAVRYARHWLDVLRYTDEDSRMIAATGMHLWRDWVINALDDDLPYDDFVQIQLTGRRADERTRMSATGYRSEREPRPGDRFALGFLARGSSTGENPENLAINAVDTVSSAFMGVTVACAKCHDHLFDPISEVDYYSMKALFDPLVLRKVTLASAEELMEAGKAMAEREKKRAPLERELTELLAPFKQRLYSERVEMLPSDVRAIILKPETARSVAEQRIADDYFPILRIDGGKINEILTDAVRKQSRALEKRLDEASRAYGRGPRIRSFYTVEIDPLRAQEKSYVLTSADTNRPELDNEVRPGWPFSKGDYDFREGHIEAFADWLTAPENPLFARVAVNRLWQWHFGVGLHRQASDFGKQAGKPTHPKLLDWLAAEFVKSGYRMKSMHRLMVTSDAYKRASDAGSEFAKSQQIDPHNDTLWRFPLQRLEAEPIWDAIHTAAGNLDLEVGGRSFYPRDDDEKQRRGIYIKRGFSQSRDVTPNFLQTFDVDDGRVPCPLRTQTVTAPQSLFLMNSPEIETASKLLAKRIRLESGGDLGKAIQLAYQLTVARLPTEFETDRALDYLQNDVGRFKQLCWLLFNLDEFIYVR